MSPFLETNRNCPKWAEFNTPQPVGGVGIGGGTPGATSPPAHTPYGDSLFPSGYRSSANAYGFPAAVPSPLATSPPVSATAFDGFDTESQPAQPAQSPGVNLSGPKIKLKLGGKKP